jgi:hypothetical protein
MRPRDRGNIVNVGSALAFVGIPLQGAYCLSKFACRGFFESTRAELLHEGSHVHLTMVHLPAVNTLQFDWCETTLDRHPQPVAPIYQPEVPAKYILQAALDGRRSKTLGSWNKMLVFTDTLFPGFGNQYAALAAWDGQLTGQPLQNDRPSNLHEPADSERDFGAHGTAAWAVHWLLYLLLNGSSRLVPAPERARQSGHQDRLWASRSRCVDGGKRRTGFGPWYDIFRAPKGSPIRTRLRRRGAVYRLARRWRREYGGGSFRSFNALGRPVQGGSGCSWAFVAFA